MKCAKNAGQAWACKGEAGWRSVLCPSHRAALVRAFMAGTTVANLANMYGVSTERVEQVIRLTVRAARPDLR